MADSTRALGIDFGTSNSAAGYLDGDQIRLIGFGGQPTLPTTFFFNFDTRQTLLGEPANRALLDGEEGRFMRALKRVLGTSLMHEKRQILNERVTFVDIIARFLNHIKTRAEAETGHRFTHALSGRPVVFHGTNDAREQQAEDDLRACYLAAGFTDVEFMAEPQAAAIASGTTGKLDEIGLIVDIGGGTSDFSLFRSTDTGIDILANHGVRIGGTDFDRALSFARVMPLLGRGTHLRDAFGPGTNPAPNAIFLDLATWEKIPFLYTQQNRRKVDDMLSLAEDPGKFSRLASVLQDELGHEVAFEVERGKIAANNHDANAQIDLSVIERALSLPLHANDLNALLTDHAQNLHDGIAETLRLAQLSGDQVNHVIYVGGSSLLSMVSATARAALPNASHSFSEAFTGVVNGLARASATLNND
ncbi:Hsp70 family protein [Shimia abyssi]|uniref:Putative chaperone protein n=1 Tax=Shimia abyssi TaxID=1662395 RepID=A0A2P8FJV0_9RHOB|nr:Hsp70 family protein [Shimia abyssi]PSL21959.1 putative chaperone protein [Shimia abyssi]